jgi:hypothetical protein
MQMAKSYISMSFITDSGKQAAVNIQDPKDNLTDAEIKAVMDTIITSKAFKSSNGIFVAKDSAKLVTTQDQAYTL